MLLASLQSKPECLVTKPIYSNTYYTARNISLILLSCCQESGSRAAITHREAKPLSASNSNICSPGGRLFKHCKREQIAIGGNLSTLCVYLIAELCVISNSSICSRVLNYGSKALRINLPSAEISHNNLYIKPLSSCSENALNLRKHLCIYKQNIFAGLDIISAAQIVHNSHSLCGALRIVQHRAV